MKQDKLLLIAGSAGSLQVVLAVLTALGREYPIPVLVVLHRNNVFESSLEELMASRTNLVIKEVEEKESILPGIVYLCPADYHVLVEQDHTFSLDYSERVNYSRPSIDVSMRSAADVYGSGLITLLLSGGNIDPLAHSRVIERGLAADGRIYRFDALISDRPGGLAHLSGVLASAEANITEIVHNRTFAGPDLSRVHVLCTVETRDRAHIAEIQHRLAENGVELVHRNGPLEISPTG